MAILNTIKKLVAQLFLSVIIVILTMSSAQAAQFRFSVLAGEMGGSGSNDGVGADARFYGPTGVAVDSYGNIYIADVYNSTIRKITPECVVTTFAGNSDGSCGFDGPASEARFSSPRDLAFDSSGNLFVADTANHTIRKITPGRYVTTFAGALGITGSTDGIGANARFNRPTGVAVDSFDNLYIADYINHVIRKITPGGVVTTLAGSAGNSGSADGKCEDARFFYPSGVVVDSFDNVFVADTSNHSIRKISPDGIVSTFVGTSGSAGSADGTGVEAQFYNPERMAVDSLGNFFVADTFNHTIRKITPGGVVTTFAGTSGLVGSADGLGAEVCFFRPKGVAVDLNGNVIVADSSNSLIRRITPGGLVSTVAGSMPRNGFTDGTGAAARFLYPEGVAADSLGNVFVSDSNNNIIRKITPRGEVTTLAGNPRAGAGSADGAVAAARFDYPKGMAVDSAGNLFVADRDNHTIRKITADGVVSTFAGFAGTSGSANGIGAAARFSGPSAVAIDSYDNIFVTDSNNHTVRKITSAGLVTTIAGTAGSSGSANGTGAAARFYYPYGVAVDSFGNLYVADTHNHTIRKITAGGLVSTVAGSAGVFGSADGKGATARFYKPYGVAVDSSGDVFITDSGNATIRRISTTGMVTTIGGKAAQEGGVNGLGGASRFCVPKGICFDSRGILYVADTYNHAIRKGYILCGADFNQNGSEDVLWSQTSTGERGLWMLDGGAYTGDSAMLPTVPAEWRMVGVDDFNADGQVDILWQNHSTGSVYVWYMNGSTYTGNGDVIATLLTEWRVAGTGDFNSDGKPDIIWQNISTGDRYIWFMDGKTYTGSYVFLGNVPTNWTIVASGDMDQDGKPDLLWRNGDTGEVGEWLMDGGAVKETLTFGSIPLNWSLRQVLDVDCDGKADILWSNLQNGELGAWLMDGPYYTGEARMLPSVPTSWLPGTSPANGAP